MCELGISLSPWALGVRVTTMQPLPQVGQSDGAVMGAVVGPVRLTGGHLDHFLGRCTPCVTPSAWSTRSVMLEANVRPDAAESPAMPRVPEVQGPVAGDVRP